jgi:vacuolar-type H+-ATPase subunit D/Vma8
MISKSDLLKATEDGLTAVEEGMGALERSRDSLIQDFMSVGMSQSESQQHYFELLEDQLKNIRQLRQAFDSLKAEINAGD